MGDPAKRISQGRFSADWHMKAKLSTSSFWQSVRFCRIGYARKIRRYRMNSRVLPPSVDYLIQNIR